MKQIRTSGIAIFLAAAILSVFGCAGTAPLNTGYRAGDTVAIGAGWKQHFDRNSLTVTFTGSDGSTTVYPPGDPGLRAVINLYPDPVSYLVVGTRTGSNDGYGSTYGSTINNIFTGNDPDWWQTTLYVDLPANLPAGAAQISIQSSQGESYAVSANIIPGQGTPSPFSAQNLGDLTPTQLQSMEREPAYTVQFSGGSTMPAALQIDLTHNPSILKGRTGGTGKPSVINPRGEMKNLSWTDNGTNLRVLLLTSGDGTSKDPYFTSGYKWKYFKFYVAGGITGLQIVPSSVKAYDSNGYLISGVTATVE